MACGGDMNDPGIAFDKFDPEDLDLLTRFHPLNNSAVLQSKIKSLRYAWLGEIFRK